MTTDIPGILDKAADLIDKHGRSTVYLEAPDGTLCVRGAIMLAAGESFRYGATPTEARVCAVLADALDLPAPQSPYVVQCWSNSVSEWNVNAASTEEVTSTLREVAARLRLGAPIDERPALEPRSIQVTFEDDLFGLFDLVNRDVLRRDFYTLGDPLRAGKMQIKFEEIKPRLVPAGV